MAASMLRSNGALANVCGSEAGLVKERQLPGDYCGSDEAATGSAVSWMVSMSCAFFSHSSRVRP